MFKISGKRCLILLAAILAWTAVFAQNVTPPSVQGMVVDETGTPVIGASIFVQNTQNGTVTDLEGQY